MKHLQLAISIWLAKSRRKHISTTLVARKTVREIDTQALKWDLTDTCAVLVAIDAQSPDIAQGVNEGEGDFVEQGAGIKVSCSATLAEKTPEYAIADRTVTSIDRTLSIVRKNGTLPFCDPMVKARYRWNTRMINRVLHQCCRGLYSAR